MTTNLASLLDNISNKITKLGEEKKGLITGRYEEHSKWLVHEFSLIRELITKIPSNNSNNIKSNGENIPVSNTSNHNSNDTKNSNNIKNASQKRKSPEVAFSGSSPVPKRSSADSVEIAKSAGLPSDLTKMKKDQLLNEIQSRGGSPSISMKSLKKDMIIALKALLNMEYANNNNNQVIEQSPEPSNTNDNEPVVTENIVEEPQNVEESQKEEEEELEMESSTTSDLSQSKAGSVMTEFRNQLQNNDSKTDTEDDVKQRVAAEFQARQRRHRDSQARKSAASMVAENASVDSSSDESSKEVEDIQNEVAKDAPLSVDELVSDDNSNSSKLEQEDTVKNSQEESSNVTEPKELNKVENSNEIALSSSMANSSMVDKPKTVVPSLQLAAKLKEQEAEKAAQKKLDKLKREMEKNSKMGQEPSKWDRLNSGKSAVNATTAVAPVEKPKSKGLFGFMKSAKLLLSGQKAPKSKAAAATPTPVKTVEGGPTTIADLRALLAAEANAADEDNEESDEKQQSEEVQNAEKVTQDVSKSVETSVTKVESTKAVTETTNSSSFAVPSTKVEAPVEETSTQSQQVQQKSSILSSAANKKEEPVATKPVQQQPQQQQQQQLHQPIAVAVTPNEKEKVTTEYQIDDRDDSDSDDSGTDDEGSKKDKKNKMIPDWARGSQLKEALEKQYGLHGHTPVDPDHIFPEIESCDLEEIFGKKEGKSGKYSRRTSSAMWDADELTLVEKRTYRDQMGFKLL